MDKLVGQIALFAFAFAPRGWVECDGAVLSIAQNTDLFSLLGSTFGGDGMTSFAVPNLKQRVPCENLRYCISLGGAFPLRSERDSVLVSAAKLPGYAQHLRTEVPDPNSSTLNETSEREHLRGWLTKTTRYRLMLTGQMGVKEIENLIDALETQKRILSSKDS